MQHQNMFKNCMSEAEHYRLGNAFYKEGIWKKAIEHYLMACELNAESPARERLKMTYRILEFYNTDVYGQ